MKLKITNPWISISLFLIASMGLVLSILDNDDSLVGTIGAIMATSGILLFALVYFPIIIIVLFGDKIKDKAQVVNNIGLFSIGLIVIGSFMRLLGLPGAGVIVVVSSTFFYLNFLPAWYAAQYKNTDRFGRVFYFLFGTSLGILILGYQFKVMHWPGANFMSSVSLYTALFTLLPMGIIILIKRDKRYFSISQPFLFGFILAYILSGYVSSKIANKNFANNTSTFTSFDNNLKLYQGKSRFLYDALANTHSSDSTFILYKTKADTLKNESDKLYRYIQELKTLLIKETDGLIELNSDSISFEKIQNKTNYDMPTHILIGDDERKPKRGEHSAVELKEKIQNYIQEVGSILPEDIALEFKQSIPFDFNDSEEEDGQKLIWEIYSFYHIPLSTIYSTLTNYQANMRYMEMTALNELFNKANSNNKQNMAAQLAELAMKYETTKKEKEISVLQKDKELSDIKIEAKDQEISNREKTITYFILAIIAFGVLMVFVVRSNVLRKQANKLLSEQKEVISEQKAKAEEQRALVEEKQNEIIDSITYAKRLQQAILPSLQMVKEYLPESFIYYQPKDIVAGDFYWMEHIDGYTYIAAADCTGHGVPGAMVSVVCSNALNRTVKEFGLRSTGDILDKTRELVIETFEKSDESVKDGMDISLMRIESHMPVSSSMSSRVESRDENKGVKIQWSGANNSLWYILNNELIEIKADKQPIGKYSEAKRFTTHDLSVNATASFYLFSDGYADQFSLDDKKLMKKKFKDAVFSIQHLPMQEQSKFLEKLHVDWKGNMEQTDDVLVIGIRV